MKNKEEKTLLILQLHTKKNITTCAPVQLQNELRKKQTKTKNKKNKQSPATVEKKSRRSCVHCYDYKKKLYYSTTKIGPKYTKIT